MTDTVITIVGRSAMMLVFFSLVFCSFAFMLIGVGAMVDAAKKRKAARAKAGGAEEMAKEFTIPAGHSQWAGQHTGGKDGARKKSYEIQKQVVDELVKASCAPCKSKMPPSVKDASCAECAAKMGKVPVDYPVGHWAGCCDFCGQEKSLSSLSHDYVDKKADNK